MSIKTLIPEERPRERLFSYGVQNLTDVDLVAIILGKGVKNKSVLDVSRDLCKQISVSDLPFSELSSLQQITGIGSAKACVIKAAIELGRRSFMKIPLYSTPVITSKAAFSLLQPHLQGSQEKFVVLFMNSRKKVLAIKTLFVGTIDRQLVSTREVLKEALSLNATSIIISHNHPSGELTPSDADYIVTEKIVATMNLCQIGVDDHIIVSGNEYYSFVEHGSI